MTTKALVLLKLPETLKKMMQAKNITPTQLAEKAGISYSSLKPILNGTRECGVSKIAALANALECTPDVLLQGLYHASHTHSPVVNTSKQSPRFLLAFISIIKVTYCRLHEVNTGENIDLIMQFPLRCGDGVEIFLEHIFHGIEKLSMQINENINLKETAIFASIQQYARETTRKKIQVKGEHLFASFLLEPDATTNYKALIGKDNGICISINDGDAITYSTDNGNSLEKLQGHGFPISDVAGNFWLGCETIRHAIAVKEKREAPSLTSDRILALFKDDLDYLACCVFENTAGSYLNVSNLLKELIFSDEQAFKIIKKSANLLLEYVHFIDTKTHDVLPIALAGELADLYEPFFPQERLIQTVARLNDRLLDYGMQQLLAITTER